MSISRWMDKEDVVYWYTHTHTHTHTHTQWNTIQSYKRMSLARGLSILFTFSKNQLLVLLIFYIVFWTAILLISSLILIISFLLLTLGLFVLFLLHSGGGLSCQFKIFFFEEGPFAMNVPLSTAFVVSHRFWEVVHSLLFALRYFLTSFPNKQN